MCEDMCHIPRGSVMIYEAELCHDIELCHDNVMMMAMLKNEDQADCNPGPDKTDNHTTGCG